jgi:sec-independent protein translocase protein TatC
MAFRAEPNDRLSSEAHLGELRRRLIVSFSTVGATFILCYAFADSLVAMLSYPIRQTLPPNSTLVFTALTEAFMTYLQVAFWAALILSTPVLLFQVWGFVAPGLYERERRLGLRLLAASMGLFALGGGFGYWVVMPVALSITLGFANQGLEALPRLQNYLLFAIKATFTFGLVFEIPFVMAFVSRVGLVPPDSFRLNRKAYYIAFYVLAVLLVPTDVFSQILLFVPLMGIYEVGMRLGEWLTPRSAEKR